VEPEAAEVSEVRLRRARTACNINVMTTRREFLGTLAVASAAACTQRSVHVPPAARRIDRIGLQLYTVRRDMAVNVESTLQRVSAIGYRDVEFAGYYDRDPAKLRATLDALQLAAPSTHVGLPDVEAKWSTTAAAARVLGHRWVIVASVNERGAFSSIAGVKSLAARFNAAGRRARDAGLRIGFHNHNSEFKPVDGAEPLEVLLSETDPSLVDFEMDLYWITQAGADPLAYFARHPGRFKLAHAKDSGGPPAHEMRDVGAGVIDWKKLLAPGTGAGFERFFVEHDQPKDAFASVAASYAYLKALEF
jgi:sugar phosphate isomerase/epimerase